MAKTQSAALERKKLMGDPVMITTIVVLIAECPRLFDTVCILGGKRL